MTTLNSEPIKDLRGQFASENSVKESQSSPEKAPVVFVESYPQVIAGQQQTLMSLLDSWSGYDIPAIILTPSGGVYVDELRKRGVRVIVVPQPALLDRYGGAVYRDRLFTRIQTRFQAIRYIGMLRKLLCKIKVRGVFCNDMRGILTAGIAARSLRLPVMTWDKLDKPHGKLDLIELPLLQRTAVISNAVLSKFPAWQLERYQKRIELVPDGADLPRFDKATPIRTELELPEGAVVIGIVGTVCERKGHDRILASWLSILKRFPDAFLLVIGSWEDESGHGDYFESLPNRNHPRVHFLGSRTPEEIPRIMQSLDILAVPSRHEGMGLVIAEAMACHIPVAGAKAGGIPEIVVDGETGLLFDGDDPIAIEDALVKLCESSELRRRMGEAGRARVEKHFNRPQQMRRICQLFRELIN